MTTAIFDIKRDNELIKAGTHFWCQTCVVARPLKEQSPDPRYCKSCYVFLKAESSFLPATRHPGWIPKKQSPVSGGVDSTLTPIKSHSRASQGKKKRLPRKKILEMAAAGISPRIIVGRLKAEYRMDVPRKTIQELINAKPNIRQTLPRESKKGQLSLEL